MRRSQRATIGLALGALAWALAVPDEAAAQASASAQTPAAANAAKPATKPVSKPAARSAAADENKGESALKFYDAGVKAWQSGKAEVAVQELTSAIATSRLPPQQMARALYYRGLSQRKLGKPAQAISDLQSAIWLKGALSDSERSEAMAARAAAYREAGIADPQAGKVAESATSVGPAAKVSAAPAQRAAEAKPEAAAALRDSFPPPPANRAERAATATPAPVSVAAQVSGAAPGWQANVREAKPPAAAAPVSTQSVASPPPALPSAGTAHPGSTFVAPPQTAAAPAETGQSAGSGAGSFLSSLFGGLSLGSSMPAAPEMPARRVPPAPALAEDPDAGRQSASGEAPWAAAKVRPATSTARVAAAAPAITAATTPATTGSTAPAAKSAAPAVPAAITGRYRLQVASAKSKAEAEKIAARLKREQSKAVAQRLVEIDQQGGDNAQAAVWRVRLGPFATANEPRNLCVKLRQNGYDCLVVTQ